MWSYREAQAALARRQKLSLKWTHAGGSLVHQEREGPLKVPQLDVCRLGEMGLAEHRGEPRQQLPLFKSVTFSLGA